MRRLDNDLNLTMEGLGGTPPWERPQIGITDRLRRKLGAVVVDNFFLQTARLTRMMPVSHPRLHRVRVDRDLPYQDSGSRDHLLDVYRPADPPQPGSKRPVVLYIHGGGFRVLSKETHWLFGLMFARRGYVVFNINYRLAPKHPYPAAISDACAAYRWVIENAHRYGGDVSRLVVAGESAGANLATSVSLAACYERTEPWARQVFESEVVPRAVIPACGVLQVSDPERFVRRKHLPSYLHDRLAEVADAYFQRCDIRDRAAFDFADPLVMLERGEAPHRPLPPFFAPCGTKDPLLDDTRRLAAALEKLGGRCAARYYPGEIHAFHAFLFRENARRCWRELFEFLDEGLR